MKTIIRCADAIVLLGETLVVVERLSSLPGLALPGGKIDQDETADEAVIREVSEETGLVFVPQEVVGVYDAPGRDPRGRYASTVFRGVAHGTVSEESGKTRVRLLPLSEFEERAHEFVADHASIIRDFLAQRHQG